MPATTWTLTISGTARRRRRVASTDVTALNASLRMLGQIAPSADLALWSRSGGRGGADPAAPPRGDQEQTKALGRLAQGPNPATPRPGRCVRARRR